MEKISLKTKVPVTVETGISKRKRKNYSRSSFIEKGNVFSQAVPVKKEIINQSENL